MKRILSLALALALAASCLALPASAAGSAVRFGDLSGQSDVMAVETLRLMGVLDGYGDGTFRPDAQLTRAQFCKMVVCVMNAQEELGLYRTVTVFPDVKPSHWAAGYINMAAKGKNAIAGFADGRFYPERTVTLGQAATILIRLLGYKDENVGGVWPDSYVSLAASIGLMDGLSTAGGNTPLTRIQAARLFVNLLHVDGAEGKSFLSTLGVEVQENKVLVSSSAVGPDGKETALRLAGSAEPYQLSGDKVSTGCLNGRKGTLVFDKSGKKVLTFLPDAGGSSRTITLASASTQQITDRSGARFAVTGDTAVFYNDKEQSWSDVCPWMNPGASLTLCLGAADNVEYIFVGGGGNVSEAVIVYKRGSADGFQSLAGSAKGYSIYKNGIPATAASMRPYDVATYSSATNTIRVCDTRLTGVYESCEPSPAEPEKLTLMGHEFSVLRTAQTTLAAFKPGDLITLLLTEDNQVAGAVKPGTEGADSNAMGVATSVSKGSVEVELLCGFKVSGKTILSDFSAQQMQGQLVRVSSDARGTVGVSRLGGGAYGALDTSTRKLGNTGLAENVLVFRQGAEGVEAISFHDLSGEIAAREISYARQNWAGQVDLIVLGGINANTVFYGRTLVTIEDDEKTDKAIFNIRLENGKSSMGPFRMREDIPGGTYVAAVSNSSGTNFDSIQVLTRLKDVPNTAWSGQSAVTAEGRSYSISPTVICFNADNSTWITLDQAHAYAQKADLYASDDGVIRAIEVRTGK